jgi:hypothetical protein
MTLPVPTPTRDELRRRAVLGAVTPGVVLPDAARQASPGAAEDADRMWVRAAAGAGAFVAVAGPAVAATAGLVEGADRRPEAMIALPADAASFELSELPRRLDTGQPRRRAQRPSDAGRRTRRFRPT